MTGVAVNEIFGPTVQGEGPLTGRRAVFVRLARCDLSCSWCFDADTRVLGADFTERKITELRPGDLVLSHRNRKYEAAKVLHVLSRHADEVVEVIGERNSWFTTPDHIFKTDHHQGPTKRRRTPAADLAGYSLRTCKTIRRHADRSESWWRGWGKGLILGDGHISPGGRYPKVWLKVCDRELAEAYSALVNRHGAETTVRVSSRQTKKNREVYCVSHVLSRAPWLADGPTGDEVLGFLAGFFDAEGSTNGRQLELAQYDPKTLDRVQVMLEWLGFKPTRLETRLVINGRENCAEFVNLVQPILDRKVDRCFTSSSLLGTERVLGVVPATPREVYNLTTTTGMFFANGALVEQCDTPYTWDWDRFDPAAEIHDYDVEQVVAEVDRLDPTGRCGVVISGGEPMLQRRALVELAERLQVFQWVQIETNGRHAPPSGLPKSVRIVASPKLTNSGMPEGKRIVPSALRSLRDWGADFKFVCSTPDDLDEVETLARQYSLSRVWVMPEGTTNATINQSLSQVADEAIGRGFNVTNRLHVALWGPRRGV